MKVAITGHRPPSIGGFLVPNPTYNKIMVNLRYVFKGLNIKTLYTGMAQGVDQWSAELAIELGISFIAAIPCEGQENLWPKASKEKYRDLLTKAKEVILISSGHYTAEKMQIRNRWLVDTSDLLVAVFNGKASGTKNCVNYAKGRDKTTIIIDPNDL